MAVVLILCVVLVLFVVAMPKFKSLQKLVDKLNLVTREILTGLPVIRAFSTEKHEEERFDAANKNLTKTNLFVNRAMTFMMPTMMLIMNGVSVLIVWNGAHGISDGQMQVGDMMAFIQYTMQIIMGFLMICMISIMLPRAGVSADRIQEILKSETVILDPKETKEFRNEEKGVLKFEHVSFRYPGADEDVLHDIHFTARPGETTAIIGSTGSGKSTLVNLIPRFYDVSEGVITLDGVDIREVSQHALRDKIGYVPQKGVLFSGDIASNILFGNPEGGESVMREAAQIAQAEEFIEEKKKRYQSHIAQGGSNVSGGQKQRVAIAGIVAMKPKCIVLDEPTAMLDPLGRKDVLNVLHELNRQENVTVILITHYMEEVIDIDKLYVMDDGKLVMSGTPREIFSQVEKLKKLRLDVPHVTELAYELQKEGVPLKNGILTSEEFTEELIRVRNEGFNVNNSR